MGTGVRLGEGTGLAAGGPGKAVAPLVLHKPLLVEVALRCICKQK